MKPDTQLLRPGRNCWRVEKATRAGVIIDADDYFRAARAAMLKARKQILLIGWDFDARIPFKIGSSDEGPEKVGKFISWLVRRTPGLQVHILRWDTGALKTLVHARTMLRIAKWWKDNQIHLRLDMHHPFGASHHQKVVVIDDDVAFCGGIDITVGRWDTRKHRDNEPRRKEPNGARLKPWHDATTILQGPVANALGDMCRARWEAAGGGKLPKITGASDCWPDHLTADFNDGEVGISRTMPEMPGQSAIHEIEALYVDLVARAKHWIYAESQYFASRKVGEAIASRLADPGGPEVVIVHPDTAEGWLEPIAMDAARARLIQALSESEHHGRLKLYHPFTAGGQPIYVHAKVMIVDDEVLRIGSSNFNNRSLRLDTECDVVIDTAHPDRANERIIIGDIRNSLMAEHLGTTSDTVRQAVAETGSIIEAIERLRGEGRSLRPYCAPDLGTAQSWLADHKILDPEGPTEMFESITNRKGLLQGLHHPGRARNPVSGRKLGAALALGVAATASAAFLLRAIRTKRAVPE